LISYVIPVVSPMIAHGKSIKKRYGEEAKVVFIGPCLAKMAEAEELEGAVDVVLTFEELDKMLQSKGKKIYEYEEQAFDTLSSQRGKAFPLGGSLRDSYNRIRKDGEYRYIHADGIESCKEIFDEMRSGHLENCCVEINICEGSCINGPDMPKNDLGRFAREMYMREYSKEKAQRTEELKSRKQAQLKEGINIEDLRREFQDKQMKRVEPNHEMISQILRNTGKYQKQDELNCGACGYKTCYDKAKAVYYGYSDVETCLPYLRKKAESMQSVMIENSPNAIVLLDKELTIKEVNPGFLRAFNPMNLPVSEMPIALFVQDKVFDKAIGEKKSILNEKVFVADLKRYFLVNLIYLEENQQLLGFFTDISIDEKRQQEFNRVKEETLRKTQEVIDKQMRVAQEIASLLGETTAETKMSLKSLNELVLKDRGGF
ncbi:MAG: hydrogenase, partial [Vallitaleaceae bacterium]|nr:hydrogenase [Vallitaleaceae bacterium]